MVSKSQFETSRSGVEAFHQNGRFGCVTACLANVGRLLLHQELTPTDLDAELCRNVDQDLLGYDRTLWMLQKGLKVHSFIDPEAQVVEKYLAKKIDYDGMVSAYADRIYGGDFDAAMEDYGSDDFRAFIDRLEVKKPVYDAEVLPYTQSGKYHEQSSRVTPNDLASTICHGGVVLYASEVRHSLGHQQLLFGDTSSGTCIPTIYYPGVNESFIIDVDIQRSLDDGLIGCDEVYTVYA